MKLQIHVTREDIDKGDVSPTSCPIALAIKRQFPIFKTVRVLPGLIYIGSLKAIHTPYSVTKWVIEHDHWYRAYLKNHGEPISFEIET